MKAHSVWSCYKNLQGKRDKKGQTKKENGCKERLRDGLGTNLLVEGTLHDASNDLSVGEGIGLEVLGVWGGDISTSNTDNGGIQMVKSLRLHDLGADLRSDSVLRPASLNSDEAVGLLDRLDDGLGIQGAN